MAKAKKTQKKSKLPDVSSVVRELNTVRDFVRYAVSSFNQAELFYGHGTFTPWDEAVFLVLEGLKLPIEQLEPYLDAKLLPPEKKRLVEIIHARVTTRKPLAYLLNKTYLQGVPFYVDERVIVPRSYLADLLVEDVTNNEGFPLIDDVYGIGSVLDLCTGSGCLAILAAHIFPAAEVDAVDLSKDALEVAKINVAASLHAERITLYQGDLFAPLKGKKYDFIITNPPYVDVDDMKDMPAEYQHEPQMALAGISLGKGKGSAAGREGIDIVRRILKEAPKHLNEGGRLICEIGYGREALEAAYPNIDFLWLDTENSSGEVFWLTKDQLS